MDNYYTLTKTLTQNQIYQLINNLQLYEYKISFDTDLEDIVMNNLDEETFQLMEEFNELNYNNLYEIVGFLVLNNIKIKKVIIMKNGMRCVIYSDFIDFKNGDEELKKLLKIMYLNPETWIKEFKR